MVDIIVLQCKQSLQSYSLTNQIDKLSIESHYPLDQFSQLHRYDKELKVNITI